MVLAFTGHTHLLLEYTIINKTFCIKQVYIVPTLVVSVVTIQNGWNNRISDGCVYPKIRRGLGMHLVIYSNHDTVLFLLIVPIKGRFV